MTDARALRDALLVLHKELLDAQRIQAERITGRMSAAETLQAAAVDLRFDWIRTLSELIGELDEALATRETDPAPGDRRACPRAPWQHRTRRPHLVRATSRHCSASRPSCSPTAMS